MAKIGESLFKKWNDGDVIRAKEYNQEHEIIRTAINDNFERINNHTHDDRYMTRDELAPYLQGGDTQVRVDIFKIISSNNGDGTYTYTLNGVEQVGSLDNEGRQILVLSGSYDMGVNHIEALIDDTLHRSSASGGLVEIDGNTIKLSDVLADGQEVTVKYYERIGIAGEHNVVVGEQKPPPTRGATLWFKVVG